VDRLAFSVLWEMDAEANITSTRFAKSVIRSEAALSYGEAQLRMDAASDRSELTASLRTLNALAKHLKAKRNAAGALTLGSPEVRFVLDSETSDPTDVGMYEHKEANSMVEEFMLLANIAVAAEITKAFPQCAMLRRHPPPTPGAFDSLGRSLAQHGLSLDASSSLALGASLDGCVKAGDAYFNKLTRILATRSMQQARYFSSGALSPADYAHYGLACPIYTHFTSPIRRYADQVVHRLLAAIIGWEAVSASTLDPTAANDLTDNLNLRHTMGQYAGRASVALHTLIFFRNKAVEEAAYVIKVRENGVVVLVPRYGIEGLVFVCEAGERSPFAYDAKTETLSAPGCRLRTFDAVRVRISVDARKAHRPKLELAIVEPPMPK
jgi:exosome complex exonuclease DIS3/RRP44